MYTDIVYATGEFIDASFAILRSLGSGPFGWFNWALISMGIVMMLWWIGRMGKYNQEADTNGTMK